MKKLIDFSDITIEKLNEICKHEGHKSFSATIISVVSSYYNKEYFDKRKTQGVVRPIKIEEVITDEQYCEMVGGKVQGGTEGNPICFVAKPGTANGYGFPLSERKRIKECAENFGLI